MASSKPISIKRRIGSVLTRSTSRMSQSSEASSAPSSPFWTTPSTTDTEVSPTGSTDISRTGSPTPPVNFIAGTPLERQPTTSSLSSSWFSRLTISSPRSDPFEAYQADKRRREKRHQKAVEKRIAAFHKTITGAVFVGTLVHFQDHDEDHSTSDEISLGGGEGIDDATRIDLRESSSHKVGVVDIAPKDPPASGSSKAEHYAAFVDFHKGEVLECYFDVFMRSIPREGTRVTFIVTPSSDDDSYVAVACNIVDRYIPIQVKSPAITTQPEVTTPKA